MNYLIWVLRMKALYASIFIAFVLFGSVRFLDDNTYMGDNIVLHANVNNRNGELITNGNTHTEAVDNLRVKFLLLDSPYYMGSSAQSNLQSDDVGSFVAMSDTYNMEPGEYWVKIYIYGEDEDGNQVKRIKHRPIYVQ